MSLCCADGILIKSNQNIMKQIEDEKNANACEYEKQVKYYMNKYKLSKELAAQLLEEEVSHRMDARLLGYTEGQRKAEKESKEKIERLDSDHTQWTNELRTQIERLSQDDTRLKELLNQYIEGTEALHHKVALTDANTANRDFSAGYCKALQDLMKHFEGIDYEIID